MVVGLGVKAIRAKVLARQWGLGFLNSKKPYKWVTGRVVLVRAD